MRVNVRFTIASTAVDSTIALSLISSGAAHATPAPRTAAVQYQSYQRASQDAACDNPPPLFAPWQSDWADATNPVSGPAWHPAWEQWPNNGTGGWTCTRAITWAYQQLTRSN